MWSTNMAKKKERIPFKGGDEFDALTRARKYYVYLTRSGVAKKIKQQYNKRFRKKQKQDIKKDLGTCKCLGH